MVVIWIKVLDQQILKLDLRITVPMQICIHRKDNSRKHCRTIVWPWRRGPRSNLKTTEDSQPMTSYKLVSYCKPLGPIISQLSALLSLTGGYNYFMFRIQKFLCNSESYGQILMKFSGYVDIATRNRWLNFFWWSGSLSGWCLYIYYIICALNWQITNQHTAYRSLSL